MKKIPVILIIALCLAMVAMPAALAKNEPNDHAGPAGTPAAGVTPGQDSRPAPGGTGMNTTGSRDTNKGEGTAGPSGQGMLPGNETPKVGAENAVTPQRTISGGGNTDNKDKGQPNAAATATTKTNTPVRAGWTTNPNQVREAAHAMIALETRAGGIGPQVSEIARTFNNSAGTSEQLQNRIENRDFISAFLFGGDKDAATQMTALTVQNRAAIQTLQNLMNSADLDADTKAALEQQIQVMQAEQDRLDALAAQAQAQHGLFG